MKKKLLISITFLLLFLFGCAANIYQNYYRFYKGKSFQKDEISYLINPGYNKYLTDVDRNKIKDITITLLKVDNYILGEGNGLNEFYVMELQPGPHILQVSIELSYDAYISGTYIRRYKQNIKFNSEPGKKYALKYNPPETDIASFPNIFELPSSVFVAEIKEKEYKKFLSSREYIFFIRDMDEKINFYKNNDKIGIDLKNAGKDIRKKPSTPRYLNNAFKIINMEMTSFSQTDSIYVLFITQEPLRKGSYFEYYSDQSFRNTKLSYSVQKKAIEQTVISSFESKGYKVSPLEIKYKAISKGIGKLKNTTVIMDYTNFNLSDSLMLDATDFIFYKIHAHTRNHILQKVCDLINNDNNKKFLVLLDINVDLETQSIDPWNFYWDSPDLIVLNIPNKSCMVETKYKHMRGELISQRIEEFIDDLLENIPNNSNN